ncbi:MAG: TIGR03668 family PPOX class F420-dependent oxidoreductase [Umezawaea sp.]
MISTVDAEHARDRFAAARVARLATADGEGRPHLVPVTFALQDDIVVIAVDHKPKTTTDLKRLRNIAANDQVSMLVDHYDDRDWSLLWWVRADGVARVLGDGGALVAPLRVKYPQHREVPPTGPVIRVDVHVWRGWSAIPPAPRSAESPVT